MIKTFHGKRSYNIKEFGKTLESSDCSDIYQNSYPEILMDKFTHIFVRALQLHAPLKKCFIRNAIMSVHYQRNGYRNRLTDGN